MTDALALGVDHLVFAAPDLAAGERRVCDLLGVEATIGGRHEGRGTRNVLIGLGPSAYLEIVGVDTEQPEPAGPRWFGLDRPGPGRLTTWAFRAGDPATLRARAAEAGIELGAVTDAGRLRPDGSRLSWSFTDPHADRLGGTIPFLIDWGRSEHPGRSLPADCRLLGLTLVHPDPKTLSGALELLGIPSDRDVRYVVEEGATPGLRAELSTPRGVVELA